LVEREINRTTSTTTSVPTPTTGLWNPLSARVLMLRGAELILAPVEQTGVRPVIPFNRLNKLYTTDLFEV
jgi:hypothetical protein